MGDADVRRLAAMARLVGRCRWRRDAAGPLRDAGVPLRDAQILARHADPRTTEHYDRAWGNLDRRRVHFLTAYLADVQPFGSRYVNTAHYDALRVKRRPCRTPELEGRRFDPAPAHKPQV